MERALKRIRTGTIWLIFVLTALYSAHAISGPWNVGERSANADPNIDGVSFLIGEWELDRRFGKDDAESRPMATLRAKWTLNGYGILVEEVHPTPDGEFVTNLIYAVHPETRKIVGTSNNTLGNRKFYDVETDSNELLITQTGEMFQGRPGYNMLRMFNIEQDRFQLELRVCQDGTDVCNGPTYSYIATRTK